MPEATVPGVEDLTLAQRVGQLFQLGFEGREPTEEIRSLVAEHHVGGVVYFARNLEAPAQIAELSAALQELALDATGVPLLVSVDEEGGRVSRLPFGPRPPGAMAVGATADPEFARDLSAAVATQLRAVGVNANLAPVLDVATNPENPVIGTRSFGGDPERVGAFGVAAAAGLQSRGIVACGKHFPGHGDTATDSHHGLPVVDHDRDRLDSVELLPFRRAVDAGVDALMTAHVAVPAVEPDPGRPATTSRAVLTGLLREELGFEGVVVTDCLEMDAIADGIGTARGAVEAIAAGADAVLVSHTPERQRAAIEAVLDAVRDGTLPEARVNEAAERLLALKRRRLDDGPTPDVASATNAAQRASRRVAREAVTVVRDEAGNVPLAGDRLSLVSLAGGDDSPVDERRADVAPFIERLSAGGYDVQRHTLTPGDDPSPPTDGPVVVVTRDAVTDERQATAVGRLTTVNGPLVVLAVGSPHDVRVLGAGTVVATYDESPAMLAAAADVLAGEREARGTLPVDVG